jgi:hypothetical protein
MSILTKEEASRFLAPLRGNLTILLVRRTQTKVRLGRFLLRCAGSLSLETTLLDTDAFISANIDRFVDEGASLESADLFLLPEGELEVSCLLPLLSSRRQMLIIDDLNSLHSLALDGQRSRQLTIMFKLLSFGARMNGSWAIAIAYRTELPNRRDAATRRSLTSLGDQVVEADLSGDSLRFKADLNGGWPGDEFRIRDS